MSICNLVADVEVKHPRLMYALLSAAYLTGTLRWLRDPIVDRMVRVSVRAVPVEAAHDH